MKRKNNFFEKSYLILMFLVFLFTKNIFGQVYVHDFGTIAITAHPYITAPPTFATGLSSSVWTNSTSAWTNFGGSTGQAIALNNSGGTPTITLTFSVNAGYQLNITGFSFWRQRSASGAQNYALTCNSNAVTTGTIPTAGTNTGAIAYSQSNITGSVSIVLSLSGATGTGTFRLDDFTINGSVVPISTGTSDIIATTGFVFPTNINYKVFQGATLTTANSIEVGQFTIRDGGTSAPDADATATNLTALVLSLSNNANIRRVALFDGSTNLAEVAGSATPTFGSLTLSAPDDGTKTFSIRVSFNTAVTDNQQFQLAITNATATGTGFASANAGGASTSIASDNNRIEVIADRLTFTTQPITTIVNNTMSPVVLRSVDINNNLDLDYSNVVSVTSTGTMNSPTKIATASAGIITFNNIFHTTIGTGLTLNAIATGLTSATSNTFNIIVSTALQPGDIAILGFNYDTNGSGEDEIIIVFFKDVVNGTTLDITDNAFKKCGLVSNPSLATNPIISTTTPDTGWGVSEGWIRLTYSGALPFPAGQTLTFRITPGTIAINIVAPLFSGWSGAKPSNVGTGFNLNGLGEQIFFLSGGTPDDNGATAACSAAGTYTGGRFLYGFNTKGNYWVPSCQNSAGSSSGGGCGTADPASPTNETLYGGTKNSAKPANFDCYLAYPTAQADFNCYIGDLSPTSKRGWIDRINKPSNWAGYASSALYYAYANPTFTNATATNSGRSLTINTGGFTSGVWVGNVDNDWFYCSNWQDLRIPDVNTNVTINPSPTNFPRVDVSASPYATFYGNVAQCFNIDINESNLQFGQDNQGSTADRLDVYGNLTISGTGSINMSDNNIGTTDGELRIQGNFSNNTLANTNFTAGNGKVTFNGTTEQTLNGIGGETFYNININNPTRLKLLNNINVTNTLSLTQGKLNLNAKNIEMGDIGRLSENIPADNVVYDATATNDYNKGGYIRIQNRTITNTLTNLQGIGLLLGHTAGSNYDVQVLRRHYAGKFGVAIKRIYDVIVTSGNASGTNTNLQINYADSELNGNDKNQLKMYRFETASGWSNYTNGFVNTPASNLGAVTTVNGFSAWTLLQDNIVLPNNFLNCKAILEKDNQSMVSWTNNSNNNQVIHYFNVQKSYNGIDFFTIAQVEGNKYQYFDILTQEKAYYRVLQVDVLGQILESNIAEVNKQLEWVVYPNPSSEIIYLNGFKNGENIKIIAFDAQGKMLFEESNTFDNAQKLLQNNFTTWTKGLYLLKVQSNGKYKTFKILKN